MKHCPECHIDLKGEWESCPLCHRPVLEKQGPATENPFPDIPLRFDRRNVRTFLLFASLVIIVTFSVVERIWFRGQTSLLYPLFAISSLWVVLFIILRKRRNIAKGIVYMIILFSLLLAYLDYGRGWQAWSVTYAIPIIILFAVMAIYLSIRLVKMEPGDYVLYYLATGIIGIIPGIFLLLDMVTNPVPSRLSLGISVLVLALLVIYRGRVIVSELRKRTDV